MDCPDPCKNEIEAKEMYDQAGDVIKTPGISQESCKKAIECRECASQILAKDAAGQKGQDKRR